MLNSSIVVYPNCSCSQALPQTGYLCIYTRHVHCACKNMYLYVPQTGKYILICKKLPDILEKQLSGCYLPAIHLITIHKPLAIHTWLVTCFLAGQAKAITKKSQMTVKINFQPLYIYICKLYRLADKLNILQGHLNTWG